MLFRNRRVARAMACYLLLQLSSSLLFPPISLAMMGPSQPEFTNYEAPGSTDMVNLSTGDFTYSLPVLDIPGPERGFSLPLTYKAGISLEQEASWVGLGWSLNPGAIARTVNGYADDANNEHIETTFNKKIDRGWTGGIPGVLDLGWNSISGHSGSVGLSGLYKIGWDDSGVNSLEELGVTVKNGSVTKVDPVAMASAAFTVATLGAVPPSALGAAVGSQVATTVIASTAMGRQGGVAGFNNQPSREVQNHAFYDNYWTYYNNNNTENVYGSLYFGQMSQRVIADPYPTGSLSNAPTIYDNPQATTPQKSKLFLFNRDIKTTGNTIREVAADVYQDGANRILQYAGPKAIAVNGDLYKNTGSRPISIAHDYFSVMGEGVSGTIRPYRLDVGSIAYPKLGVGVKSDNTVPHYKYMVAPFLSAYKVGFRYENSLSNGYTYHQYTPAAGKNAVGFDANTNNGSLVINDPKLNDAASRTESLRKGLTTTYDPVNYLSDTRLVQGKYIKWYSNKELLGMYPNRASGVDKGFLEFASPAATGSSSGSTTFRQALSPSSIGAFSITNEDGTTYHYSLPVYQYQTYTEANEVRNSTTIGELGKSTRRVGQPGADWTGYNGERNTGAYATTWLLTAITSADYIDQNHSGTVDAADWGGWVRFDYGKFSSRYKWRQPYIGNSYADDTTVINNTGFSEGFKETYYLNSIATRSHTALFVKSVRQDGRGHFRPGITSATSNLSIDEQNPASSLRLDEIILLDNATLSKLQTPDGIRAGNDPSSTPALTAATSVAFGPFTDGPMAGSGDDMDQVLDKHDLDADPRIRQFVEANAIKRIRFNFGYDLCRGVPNSFSCTSNVPASLPPMDEAHSSTNRSGKLTLKSVSFFGPTINAVPTKITPDFTFGYDNPQQDISVTNPGYGKDKWDAFGMYSPIGQYSVTSHKPQHTTYAAPWTLTKIISPLGGETSIAYERDEYAHVSEFGNAKIHLTQDQGSATLTVNKGSLGGNLTSVIKVNDKIYLNGSLIGIIFYGNRPLRIANHYYEYPVVVTAVSESQITIAGGLGNGLAAEHGEFDFTAPTNLVGGDIRVASITTKENTSSYQVRYAYTASANSSNDSWFNSSGVLAKEPPFLDRFEHLVYGVADYPNTPVIYSKVTVFRGLFKNGATDDYDTREVYSFFTPATTMISEASTQWQSVLAGTYAIPVVAVDNQTKVDIGKIGQPQKIEIFNRRGEQELSTNLSYAANVPNADGFATQGHYTEGVLNNERIEGEYRINRSTKEYVPNVLLSSRVTRNGLNSASNNLLYDFYTGQVLETAFTNSLGKVYHSRMVPAYTLPGNEGMGPKGDNLANRHMLAQPGAAYSFVEVPGGPAYNSLNPLNPATSHVLSASVQTWQNNWTNYREPDASGIYQDVVGQQPVWRQAATYTWQSPVLDTDGSFKNFTPFNWTGTSDSRWIKAGETVRYDHYSHAVEARDVNGNYAAQKTGYNQTQLIASASNARYTEIAYSGAEDQLTVAGTTHFGGEVVAAGGTAVSAPTHTGFYSLQLPGGQQGFVYRVQAGRDVTVGKTYRVSAWANANATNGKLYASLNGSRLAESSLTSATTKKAGAWYLLSLLVTVPASATGQTIEFGCANEGAAAANFDDFRVAPLTSTITSRVYDPRSNNLLYSLDNDNLYTRYEYTSTSRLRRVYQETLDQPGRSSAAEHKVKEYDYNYAQLHAPTWVTTAYRCKVDNNGNYTGAEERQVVDVNPLNTPATPAKWEDSGNSSTCTPPACPCTDSSIPYRLRNNVWEQAQQNGQPTCQSCGTQNGQETSTWIYHWIYANGDDAGDTYSGCMPGNCVQ